MKLNVLKSLAYTYWGGNSKDLLAVYRATIRSLLDYGCEAYDSACKSTKDPLNSVTYQALSIVFGTLKGTPLQDLEIEAGEMPLDLRRKLLSQKYRILLNNDANHPLYGDVQNCWQFHFNKHKTQRPSFGKRTMEFPTGVSLSLSDTSQIITTTPFPPWQIQMPTTSIELKEYFSKSDNPFFLQQKA